VSWREPPGKIEGAKLIQEVYRLIEGL